MRRIQVQHGSTVRRRDRDAKGEVLPLDPRDMDIVRVKSERRPGVPLHRDAIQAGGEGR
jgi:hypothetical protein